MGCGFGFWHQMGLLLGSLMVPMLSPSPGQCYSFPRRTMQLCQNGLCCMLWYWDPDRGGLGKVKGFFSFTIQQNSRLPVGLLTLAPAIWLAQACGEKEVCEEGREGIAHGYRLCVPRPMPPHLPGLWYVT